MRRIFIVVLLGLTSCSLEKDQVEDSSPNNCDFSVLDYSIEYIEFTQNQEYQLFIVEMPSSASGSSYIDALKNLKFLRDSAIQSINEDKDERKVLEIYSKQLELKIPSHYQQHYSSYSNELLAVPLEDERMYIMTIYLLYAKAVECLLYDINT